MRPPQLPSQLLFACEPERSLVAGSLVVDAIEGKVVVGCSCFVVTGGSKTLFTTGNAFTGGTVAHKTFHGSCFLPMAT